MHGTDRSKGDADRAESGARAILRVPEVLTAVASKRGGSALHELLETLRLPKTSLLRLLSTLENGGFVIREGALYSLGPQSYQLARVIAEATPSADFPACARPVMESLAAETGETALLCVLSDRRTESIYVDVIESEAPLRFVVRIGNRRPLFSVAAGKAMLAFLTPDFQHAYIDQTDFLQFTASTTRREEMPDLLRLARQSGFVLDRDGIVDGASAIASPAFDREGKVFCAISLAGPTERIQAHQDRIGRLVLEGAERVSRILGFSDAYPPRDVERYGCVSS